MNSGAVYVMNFVVYLLSIVYFGHSTNLELSLPKKGCL